MRTIYQTLSLKDAEMLRAELRSRGIDSALHNEHGGMYAVGIPIPAIPFEVAVADEHADAALQAVRALFSGKPPASDRPPMKLVLSLCSACGRTLEIPEGEDAPTECPWCGGDPSGRPVLQERRTPVFKAFVVSALLLLVVLALLRGVRESKAEPARAQILQDLVGSRAAGLPQAEAIGVDPEAVAALLAPKHPEAEIRYRRDFEAASDIEGLVEACVGAYTELGPDWAVELGLRESPLLTRHTPAFLERRALLEALALGRLRGLKAVADSLDAALLERWLEGGLAWFAVHGPHPKDPRQPYVGITASHAFLESGAHSTLARRLAQVPEVLREAEECLRDPPRLWIEAALHEIPGVLELLDRFEKAAPAEASAARAALHGYRDRLETRLPTAGPVRVDPRWLGYLVRETEFTGLAPADLARSLREEADEALRRLNATAPAGPREPPNLNLDELLKACIAAQARARELSLEDGHREGATVRVEAAPPHFRNWPGSLCYVSRPFSADLRPRLYVEAWPGPERRRPALTPEQLLLTVQGETWPGKHLMMLRTRAHASLMKRVYGIGIAEAGWAAFVRHEADGSADRERLLARWREAWWGLLDLAVSGGALREDEAVEFLQEWAGLELAEARREVAYLTAHPLLYAGAAWTARELRRMRDEMSTSSPETFDLRRFRESVMDYGSTPIARIRQAMPGRK